MDHQKRHRSSRLKSQTNRCHVCSKYFARSDSLLRHTALHEARGNNIKHKSVRACFECAIAKTKCTNSIPCRRCSMKDLHCKYPPTNSASLLVEPMTEPSGHCENVSHTASSAVDNREGLNSRRTQIPPSPDSTQNEQQHPPDGLPAVGSYHAVEDLGLGHSPSEAPLNDYRSTDGSPNISASALDIQSRSPGTHFVRGESLRRTFNAPRGLIPRQLGTAEFPPEPEDGRIRVSGSRNDTSSHNEPSIDRDHRPHSDLSTSPPVPASLLSPTSYWSLNTSRPPSYGFKDVDIALQNFPNLPVTIGQLGDDIIYGQTFESRYFPPSDYFRYFIMLYFKNINRVITVFHFPTLQLDAAHWILSLSIAAEGCQYLEQDIAPTYSAAMREFLRRALLSIGESSVLSIPTIELAQAKVLLSIGLAYSGDETALAKAKTLHRDLIDFCLSEWKTAIYETQFRVNPDEEGTSRTWYEWKNLEMKRRVGYLIWMLDCMMACHFDQRPLLTLEDAIVPLPYPEVLWETSSAMEWRRLLEYSEMSQSAMAAVQTASNGKTLQTTMGEFSRILVVHGFHHRDRDLRQHSKQRSRRWSTNDHSQTAQQVVIEATWLPEDSAYSHWRDATCSSLDNLHQAATRMVQAAGGTEHPTIYHLHLARVVLLAPTTDIRHLALGLTRLRPQKKRELLTLRQIVQKWVFEDHANCRLAVFHSGNLFWHIRRFSANGFYEPYGILLASLTLWAFGLFNGEGGDVAVALEPTFDEHGTSLPISINLDRPADDELISTYARGGSSMLGLMSGVGDICGPQGPQRILLEAIKLLNRLPYWGCTRECVKLLTCLSLLSEQMLFTDFDDIEGQS